MTTASLPEIVYSGYRVDGFSEPEIKTPTGIFKTVKKLEHWSPMQRCMFCSATNENVFPVAT